MKPGNKPTALIVLAAKLPESSMLRIQLGVSHVLKMRIGTELYRNFLSERLSELSDMADIHFAPSLASSVSFGELRGYLDSHVPLWKTYDQIVFYPTHSYFLNAQEFSATLKKLCLVSKAVRLGPPPYLVAMPMEKFKDGPSTIAMHEGSELSDIEVSVARIDLSRGTGPFELSKTQTVGRSFNSFQEALPFLLKRSKKPEKSKAEFLFLSNLPAEMRAYFPHVGKFLEKNDETGYEVEFVPMFDLSRFFIHDSLEAHEVGDILKTVGQFFDVSPRKKVDVQIYRKHLRELFIDKLNSRLAKFGEMSLSGRINTISNSIYEGGLAALQKEVVRRLDAKIGKISETELVCSHGDLCCSNILWDRVTGLVKLIDPRGGDSDEVHLPLYYDLAKLSHSFMGHYDWIMNGATLIEFDDNLTLNFQLSAASSQGDLVRTVFSRWIQERGWDLEMIRLGEASLFLSMLPLHVDKPVNLIRHIVAAAKALQSERA